MAHEENKVVNGKTWYWCPKHMRYGVYGGLYVTHPPDKHNEWVENCENWNKRSSSSAKASTDKSSANNIKDKLTLSNNLKAAMITNFQYTSEQTDKL